MRVWGGRGGHSGDDINKERANALRLLIRFLYTELQYDFQLLTLGGGNKPNAICREAEAVIAVPAADIDASRSLSGGGGKPSFPSPSAGDLRELPIRHRHHHHHHHYSPFVIHAFLSPLLNAHRLGSWQRVACGFSNDLLSPHFFS